MSKKIIKQDNEKKEERPKRFYRVLDSNIKSFGQIDYVNQTIKLNPTKGDMVNTIIHEDLHAKFPNKSEQWIHRRAKKEESKLSIAQAQQLLDKFRPKSRKKMVPHYRTD